MKIVYLVLKGMPLGGGIEKYTEEIGSRLAAKGHEIILYCMDHYGAKPGEFKGMKIVTVPTLKSKGAEKLAAMFYGAVRQAFEKDVDIVHCHAFGPAMFGVIPRLMGRKTVTQGHGLEWKRSRWSAFGRWFLKTTEAPSVRFASQITVVSNVQKRYVMETYGRDSVFIPTGVNPPKIMAPNVITKDYGLKGRDYILSAGRLVQEKGLHYLLEAYNSLKTDKKLVIAGDAQHEEEYKALLRKLAGDNPNIIFTGFVTGEPLWELMSNAYFFVLPSELEGLPTVLLEAMSYKNACLVSDIPENLEALNSLGFTFQNMNVADFAGKMKMLLDDPALVDSVKEKAGEYVLENYAWDDIADKFERMYLEMLD